MDFSTLLMKLIADHPGLVALVVTAPAIVKAIVTGLRKFWPCVAGNYVQTITLLVSLGVVGVEGITSHAIAFVHWRTDSLAYLACSALVWLAAIGFHNVMSDQGPSRDKPRSKPEAPPAGATEDPRRTGTN